MPWGTLPRKAAFDQRTMWWCGSGMRRCAEERRGKVQTASRATGLTTAHTQTYLPRSNTTVSLPMASCCLRACVRSVCGKVGDEKVEGTVRKKERRPNTMTFEFCLSKPAAYSLYAPPHTIPRTGMDPEQGFLGPFCAFDEAQAAVYLAQYEQAFGPATTTAPSSPSSRRFQSHLFLPFVAALMSNETILQHVRAILGPNLLVWFTEWHTKPPLSKKKFTPHQDSTYAGLAPPDDVVTVWVALTEASRANGCLEFVPMHEYNDQQLPHVEEPGDPTNLLLKGQRIPSDILDFNAKAVPIELRPGQATIHAFRCVHASGPNHTSDSPRVGLAIRYMKPSVRQTQGHQREGAVLVSGKDEWGHFDLLPIPKEAWCEEGLKRHEREMEAMQVNYMEQQEKQEKEGKEEGRVRGEGGEESELG